MENLTCEAYLANPELQSQVEKAARRERAQAMESFMLAPLQRFVKNMFRRTQQVAVRPMHVPA